MLPADFCAFILTHGRPDRVYTYKSLRDAGYTGRILLVIDNEDRRAEEYRQAYGAEVVQFDKLAVAGRIDEGDNFGDRRAILYARNACFEIARERGIGSFIQLDDDYTLFQHRFDHRREYVNYKPMKKMDDVLSAMLDFLKQNPMILSVAMSQTGDFPGGKICSSRYKPSRKAMNSFICLTDRPFKFFGRINEDVNTYSLLSSRGAVFLTIKDACLMQKQTQSNKGGMTDLYLDSGTYVKSFYSVMFNPSAVKVVQDQTCNRLHHQVRWRHTAAQIVPELYRLEG